MKKAKKVLSMVLALIMCFSCMLIPAEAATFNDINQSSVFVKQQTNYTCTLAAAVMMVRRTAMAAGNSNWSSITESSMRGTAWLEDSGLYYSFTYAGVSVGHSTISSNRKSTYINLLKTYPQGVVAWNAGNGGQYHAVLLTDYDANTNTFYCSDPANGTAGGRIPLSSSSIVGSGQDGKINNLNHYWYVKSPSVTLTSNEPTTIIYPTNGGIYKIAAGVGNNMYLDFACTNINVQIYENCDGHSNPDFVKSQYFKLTHVGDGWYSIINTGNGLAIDIESADPTSSTNIQQYVSNGTDAQLYRFYDAGNGYCYIKSKLGCYVDVKWGDSVNNTNVWAYDFNGNNSQKWKLQSHSHSYSSSVTTQPTCTKTGVKTFACYCGVSYTETIAKTAHNKNTTIPAVSATCTKTGLTEGKKCSVCGTVTVAQQTVAKTNHTNRGEDNKCDVCGFVLVAEPTKIIYPIDGGIYKIAAGVGNNQHLDFSESTDNVKTYEGVDHPDQTFKLTHIGDGWYTIVSTGNGKAVDVEDANPACYTNVQQYEPHNGDNQLFRFYDAGDGYCYIKSKLGCYVDVANGQNANNTNVWMHTFNGGTPQKWKLQSHSHSYTSTVTAQPTCTEEGIKTYKCYCGASYTETIAKTSHNSNTTIPAVSATCTKTGLTEGKKCSVCGTITVAQQTIAKKSHIEVIDKAISATCSKTGLTEGKYCSVCNTVIVAQQTVATVSHIDNNGDYKCDYNCGYEFEKPAPDTPDVPDNNNDCTCMCHASGLWGLIWKILRFFYKFLCLNDTCKCGVAHY